MSISRELVESSAPDAAALLAARLLSARKIWVLGREGDLAWGDVPGSDWERYHTAFDGSNSASLEFKCSCPSRKVPCKHALALALRFVEKPDQFKEREKPWWVSDWEKARAKRAAKIGSPNPASAAAQARRIAAREQKVANGLRELELWLRDVMRSGITGLPSQPYAFWDNIAARMVDAQCPGLARRLRDMAGVPHIAGGTAAQWHEEMLHRLSGIHLLVEGYKRQETLSPERAADVRALVGWNVDQSELLQNGVEVRDNWLALSYVEETSEDSLRSGKTWLWGRDTNRAALIIEFGFGGAAVGAAAPIGSSFEGDLVFFPGSQELRALVKQKIGPRQAPDFAPPGMSAPQVLAGWANALADFPWLESWPCVLQDVIPTRVNDVMWAMSDAGSLPLDMRRINKWAIVAGGHNEWGLLAASGGRAVSLFGLWNGRVFEPLAALQTSPDGRVQVSALGHAI